MDGLADSARCAPRPAPESSLKDSFKFAPTLMNQQRAIIIGAGPAGLTAAYELLTRSGIKPIVLEKSGYMGGISRTVNYKGNRIDIGGHRFFSKSDRVMKWWLQMIPLQASEGGTAALKYHQMERTVMAGGGGPPPAPPPPRERERKTPKYNPL